MRPCAGLGFVPYCADSTGGAPLEDEPRNKRVPIMLTESEVASIDDWRFANRVGTRAEAIRRLVVAGLVRDLKKTEDARFKRLMLEGDETEA